MTRTLMILAVSLAVSGPALAEMLPDTLAGQIKTLIPDAQVDGVDFTAEEIAALEAAMTTGDSPADKTAAVQKILDEAK